MLLLTKTTVVAPSRSLKSISISCWFDGSSSNVQVNASRCGRSISVYSPLASTGAPEGSRITTRTVPPTRRSTSAVGSCQPWAGMNQRRMTSSLVQASKTSSAGASKVLSIRTTCPESSLTSLLSLVEVVADDVEEPLPALSLTFYPIGGLGKRLGAQREAMRPPMDHASHHPGLLERLQVARDRRL